VPATFTGTGKDSSASTGKKPVYVLSCIQYRYTRGIHTAWQLKMSIE